MVHAKLKLEKILQSFFLSFLSSVLDKFILNKDKKVTKHNMCLRYLLQLFACILITVESKMKYKYRKPFTIRDVLMFISSDLVSKPLTLASDLPKMGG